MSYGVKKLVILLFHNYLVSSQYDNIQIVCNTFLITRVYMFTYILVHSISEITLKILLILTESLRMNRINMEHVHEITKT